MISPFYFFLSAGFLEEVIDSLEEAIDTLVLWFFHHYGDLSSRILASAFTNNLLLFVFFS
jgi:hypothetical protein